MTESFDYYNWVVLPLLIFVSRVFDVSLGTLRHAFIAKGYRTIVPIISFFEVLIWIIVVAQVMKNLHNIACYLAFAGGFAAGTYVGMIIEERLALGLQVIRVITNLDCATLVNKLRKDNHGITVVNGEGVSGAVKIIFMIVKRKNVRTVVDIVRQHNPMSFYSIEDIKSVKKGVFTNYPLN